MTSPNCLHLYVTDSTLVQGVKGALSLQIAQAWSRSLFLQAFKLLLMRDSAKKFKGLQLICIQEYEVSGRTRF